MRVADCFQAARLLLGSICHTLARTRTAARTAPCSAARPLGPMAGSGNNIGPAGAATCEEATFFKSAGPGIAPVDGRWPVPAGWQDSWRSTIATLKARPPNQLAFAPRKGMSKRRAVPLAKCAGNYTEAATFYPVVGGRRFFSVVAGGQPQTARAAERPAERASGRRRQANGQTSRRRSLLRAGKPNRPIGHRRQTNGKTRAAKRGTIINATKKPER